MTESVLPEAGTPFGERVRQRLADEQIIWFTTIGKDGTPQPNPVWFLWQDDHILVYNGPNVKRLAHVVTNPTVSLHFDGDGKGGDIIVIAGRAGIVDNEPVAHEQPRFLEKYRAGMVRMYGTPEQFTATHPAVMRVDFTKVRGF
jgi:PPOX class probable F420-dependent enzyme